MTQLELFETGGKGWKIIGKYCEPAGEPYKWCVFFTAKHFPGMRNGICCYRKKPKIELSDSMTKTERRRARKWNKSERCYNVGMELTECPAGENRRYYNLEQCVEAGRLIVEGGDG